MLCRMLIDVLFSPKLRRKSLGTRLCAGWSVCSCNRCNYSVKNGLLLYVSILGHVCNVNWSLAVTFWSSSSLMSHFSSWQPGHWHKPHTRTCTHKHSGRRTKLQGIYQSHEITDYPRTGEGSTCALSIAFSYIKPPCQSQSDAMYRCTLWVRLSSEPLTCY